MRSTLSWQVDPVVSPAFAPGTSLPFPFGEGHGLDIGAGSCPRCSCMLERYVPAHCVVDVEQAVPLAGGALMLENETDGFAFDFGTLDLSKAVAKKIGGIDVSYHPDDFFANETTTAKLVLNALGVYEWAPHNLFLNSAAPATQSLTVLNGETYTLSVVGSGSVTVSVGGAGVATAGAPLTFTTTTTSITCTVAGTLTRIQLNRGHIATAYLATTSAARFGVPLEFRSSRRMLLSEPTLIARGLHTRNLANVAWIKTNMTATRTSVGVDDMPNGANRLTATAANATVTQAVTHAAADRYLSMFMRRITGTGAVQMTVNGGTNWTTVTSVQTIANGWERVTIPMLNVVNPNIGIRLVTSGDAIDVDMVQLDVSAFAPTSPTPSFSAAGSRAADKIYCELSSIPALGVAWSLYVVGVEYYGVPTGALYFMAISDSTTNEYVTLYAAAIGTLNTSIVDGGVAQVSITVAGARASATMQRYAMRVEANNVGASFNGAAPGVEYGRDAADGDAGLLGCDECGDSHRSRLGFQRHDTAASDGRCRIAGTLRHSRLMGGNVMAVGILNPSDNARATSTRPTLSPSAAAARRWYSDDLHSVVKQHDLNAIIAQIRAAADHYAIADVEGDDLYLQKTIAAAAMALTGNVGALQGLTGAADKVPYFTAAAAMATFTATSYSRTLLGNSTLTAWQSALGIGVGSSANVIAFGALVSSANTIGYFTGAGTMALTPFTSAARQLLDDADAPTMRSTLGLLSGATADILLYAPLASPALTGTPTAPTAVPATNSTQIATTAYVTAADALKANLASPTFTGVPAAPTATAGTNTTQIATTAFVAASFAKLASPTFTGVPAAPTATAGTNTTQLATTAFVTAATAAIDLSSYMPKAGGTFTGPVFLTDGNAAIGILSPGAVSFVFDAAGGLDYLAFARATNIGGFYINDTAVFQFAPTYNLSSVPLRLTAGAPTAAEHAARKDYVDTKAPLASPAFTGTPTAPTAAPGTNSTQIATTQFVQSEVISGGATLEAIASSGSATDLIAGTVPVARLPAALAAIHPLTPLADRLVYYTSGTAAALAPLTSFGRTLVATADNIAARTTLGLGTMAVEAATTYATAASVALKAPLASPALTGTVTYNGTALGALATKTTIVNADIAAGADIGLSKLGGIANNNVVGNISGAVASPTQLTATQVKTMLAIANTDVSGLGALATRTQTQAGDYAAGSIVNADISVTALIGLNKLGNIVTDRLVGNVSGSTTSPTVLTPTAVKTMLAIATADVSGYGTFSLALNALHIGAFSGSGATSGWRSAAVASQATLDYSASVTTLTSAMRFFNANATPQVGSITLTGAATAYNTSSDARLKRNRKALAEDIDVGAVIDALEPIAFDWPSGERGRGFDAQATHALLPEAVAPGSADDAPGDETFVPWGIDYGKLTPILLAEVKLLRTRVASLEGGHALSKNRRDGQLSSLEVFAAVAEKSPHQPLSIADMRQRVRILDAIEKADGGGTLLLEESEHKALCQALEAFPWSSATRELLTVIDDVLDAPEHKGEAA